MNASVGHLEWHWPWLSTQLLQLSCASCLGKAGGIYSQRLEPQPPFQAGGTSFIPVPPTWNGTQLPPAASVPSKGRKVSTALAGQGWGRLTPAAPLRSKGVELRWVYTGTSNDQMYIEIYKDFYINLIKQILK